MDDFEQRMKKLCIQWMRAERDEYLKHRQLAVAPATVVADKAHINGFLNWVAGNVNYGYVERVS
jgi:hypothetical protein